ncbi:hypothetical protein Alg130_09865 [Pyrenophora tritici-repentis]|nr:hypothetical protein Alg130_09865 [Pyrenophora tritici-repentis]
MPGSSSTNTITTRRMPTEPHKHDLLGFPGVEVNEPKKYIRRLWLVVNNDRISKPQFLDKHVADLAERVNSVVNTFLRKDEDKRHEELCGGAFLEKDAMHILNDKERLRWRIWGEGSKSSVLLLR